MVVAFHDHMTIILDVRHCNRNLQPDTIFRLRQEETISDVDVSGQGRCDVRE